MVRARHSFLKWVIIVCLLHLSRSSGESGPQVVDVTDEERRMHPMFTFKALKRLHKRATMPMLQFASTASAEEDTVLWHNMGQSILQQQLESKNRLNTNRAKNVIMFLGDGMSIPTITAGRIYLGGEEKQFTFETFPYVGLSKTYCANTQVADSACTATAYLGGVKANYATIGVSAAVALSDCRAQNDSAHHVASLAALAQQIGMATGLVTTTGVTHASPAGLYAHAANRNWENDAEVRRDGADPDVCGDIAWQLVHGAVGRQLDVILGGGRAHFLPSRMCELSCESGRRSDGRNLIEEWRAEHGATAHYVQTRDELLQSTKTANRILGLFAANHMPFHLDAEASAKPTLAEMVSVALDVLERRSNGRGYFLFVEGGRIDHAHHKTLALKALDETAEFDKAIGVAQARTNATDTLTVVTADHSHTMSMAGYSSRRNDIVGINDGQLADDQLPYATLSYANGPGFEPRRRNLREINMRHKDYRFPSGVPLKSETHGGDDVAVFARGPFAHIFTGVYEQHYLPHAVTYAACLGSGKAGERRRSACD